MVTSPTTVFDQEAVFVPHWRLMGKQQKPNYKAVAIAEDGYIFGLTQDGMINGDYKCMKLDKTFP